MRLYEDSITASDIILSRFGLAVCGCVVSDVNPRLNVSLSVDYDNMIRALEYKEIFQGLL